MNGTWIDRLRQVDRQRASFPGEHWLVATAGMWFLRRKGLLGKVAGAALLYRAASGRDGLRRLLDKSSNRAGSQGRISGGRPAGRQWDDRSSERRNASGAGAGVSGSQDYENFPARGAGSSYEPRGNPDVRTYPDFR